MKAVTVESAREWRLGEVPDPIVSGREVRLDIAGCGLCGTDLHTLAGDNPTVRYPITPGHEFVGTVVALGDAVRDLRLGDRVAVDPSRSCEMCDLCLSGRAHLCARKGGYGARYPGGFASGVVVREQSCVVIPDQLDWNQAVLSEPLACVLHGIRRLGPVLSKRALVLGGGPVGLLAGYVLAAGGARVTLSEPVASRRSAAAAVGLAEAVVDPSELDLDQRWDVVIDATGVAEVIEQGAGLLARGGTLLIMGVAPADARISISPALVNWQELTIVGSTSIRHTFADAVRFLGDAPDDLGGLVTHVVELDRFDEAVELARSREAVKVVVRPDAAAGS